MMNDELMDSCTLIGRLTGKAYTNTTKNGDPMFKSTVMIDRNYKDKNGKRQDASYGVPFTAYRTPAKVLANYTAKGSLVLIKAHHHPDNYTDKNGVKQYDTAVIVDMIHILESKKTTEARRQNSGSASNSSSSSDTNQPNGKSDVQNPFD